MNQTISWKILLALGIIGAAVLFFIGAGGTLGYVLYGTAGLLVILGVIGFFNRK